jgi:hypothetical protein
VQIRNAYFTCKTDWFLVIPVGSYCVFKRETNGGSMRMMHAIPCPVRPNPEV